MKQDQTTHWVTEMTVGETIYITFKELRHTQKGKPFIIAEHGNDIIYANVGRWDEDLFQEGHTYSMTCTKREYNEYSKHYYFQYKFEEIFDTEPITVPLVSDDEIDTKRLTLEVLREQEKSLEKRLNAVKYCIHTLKGE